MKIEELQKQLLDLQTKYDGLTETLKQKDELIEGFKTKETEHLNKQTEYQEQIMRLRDMNTDLFLRVSQPVQPVQDEPAQVDEKPQEETISLDDILG